MLSLLKNDISVQMESNFSETLKIKAKVNIFID